MSGLSTYETFEIEAGGASAGLLTPGRILRALASGADIRSEEVGAIELLRQGSALVEIALGRALHLATPRFLPLDEGGKPALLVLRRADDLGDEGRAELLLSSDVAMAVPTTHGTLDVSGSPPRRQGGGGGGERLRSEQGAPTDEGPAPTAAPAGPSLVPTPGEVALALGDALGIAAEELGFGLAGEGFLRVSVPLGALAGTVPQSIGIGGRRYRVESLAKKA